MRPGCCRALVGTLLLLAIPASGGTSSTPSLRKAQGSADNTTSTTIPVPSGGADNTTSNAASSADHLFIDWRGSMKGVVKVGPVISPDKSRVCAFGGMELTCFDAKSGSQSWSAHSGSLAGMAASRGDGRGLFVWNDVNHSVMAYSMEGGDFLWSYQPQGADGYPAQIGAGPVADSNIVFVALRGGGMHGIYQATGKQVWAYKEAGGGRAPEFTARMLAAPDGLAVYAFDRSGTAYAINARDGKLLWKRDAASCHFNCPPAFLTEDGTVLVVASDSVPATIQALNSRDGALLWSNELDTGVVLNKSPLFQYRGLLYYISTRNFRSTAHAVKLADGSAAPTASLSEYAIRGVGNADRVVGSRHNGHMYYVANDEELLTSVDLSTGEARSVRRLDRSLLGIQTDQVPLAVEVEAGKDALVIAARWPGLVKVKAPQSQ